MMLVPVKRKFVESCLDAHILILYDAKEMWAERVLVHSRRQKWFLPRTKDLKYAIGARKYCEEKFTEFSDRRKQVSALLDAPTVYLTLKEILALQEDPFLAHHPYTTKG